MREVVGSGGGGDAGGGGDGEVSLKIYMRVTDVCFNIFCTVGGLRCERLKCVPGTLVIQSHGAWTRLVLRCVVLFGVYFLRALFFGRFLLVFFVELKLIASALWLHVGVCP